MEKTPMTPDEYRAARERLGWSQARLARELGVDSMTVSRRERGERPISGEAEHAILRLVELNARKRRAAP